jgi:hypothetical protein
MVVTLAQPATSVAEFAGHAAIEIQPGDRPGWHVECASAILSEFELVLGPALTMAHPEARAGSVELHSAESLASGIVDKVNCRRCHGGPICAARCSSAPMLLVFRRQDCWSL